NLRPLSGNSDWRIPTKRTLEDVGSSGRSNMSHNVHADREEMSIKQGLATGTSVGAAIIMTLIGALQLLQGIAAVAEDEVFVTGQEYLFTFDLTTWGWVHIVVGVVMVIVGIALISGATWARVSAMVIA